MKNQKTKQHDVQDKSKMKQEQGSVAKNRQPVDAQLNPRQDAAKADIKRNPSSDVKAKH